MIVGLHVIINKRGLVRAIKKAPSSLGPNEIALKLEVEVPNRIFERPRLVAVMKVPDEAVQELSITPKMTTNIENIIKENVGLEMHVKVVEHTETEERN